MQQELVVAVLSGLGGMFGWGFADFFAKKTIDKIGDVPSLVWAHVVGTVTFFGFGVFSVLFLGLSISFPSDANSWGFLIFFGALQALVYLLAYQGFAKGKLAVLNPVFASYAGVAALISLLLFGESLTVGRAVALFIVFAGILLLSIDTKSVKLREFKFNFDTPGFKEMLGASLFAATWTVFWDRFVSGNDWLAYAMVMYAFMTLTILVYARAKKTKINIDKSGIWKFLFLIGAFEIVAYCAVSFGFSSTSYTSIVALLSGSFSLPTIVLARLFLKEKLNYMQTLGGLFVVIGIIVLFLN